MVGYHVLTLKFLEIKNSNSKNVSRHDLKVLLSILKFDLNPWPNQLCINMCSIFKDRNKGSCSEYIL